MLVAMSSLALDVDRTLKDLDAHTAARLERLVRDALALVRPHASEAATPPDRGQWLERLDRLRASVGTGKTGTTTEDILDDLRSDRG
jgi:hypothetical protein